MLKPADPGPPPPNVPIGELVHELIEDGKAYARAEFDLAKAIAAAKGKALALPAGAVRRRLHLRAGRASRRSPSAWSSRSTRSSARSPPASSAC